jgi:8-oxo-dGTP pyrophosphatase MutT (NUDIX family)/2'-5' RNA ligase
MVSLDLAPGVIPTLSDGVSDQHITIVFIGKGVSDELFDEVCERAEAVAASMPGPSGTVGGLGQFPPSESSDWLVPVFAIPDVPAAAALRAEFEDFNASEHTDYKPHVTLGYFEQDEQLPDPVADTPVSFTHLSVHRGDEVRRFPFAGAASKTSDKRKADEDDFSGVVAGGLIVQAQDTGRVLMIQRTPDKHDDDAAYARWEWPGGCLDVDDGSVWDGALREWEEETGSTLGEDAEHVGSFLSEDGVYQAYVIQVPQEAALEFDPQPEEVSQVGWWDPTDLDDGQIRDKVRDNLGLLGRFLLEGDALKSTLRGKAWSGEVSPGEVRSGQVGLGAAGEVKKKASLAAYHRHTDRIVSHYQTQLASDFEDLFPENALREAIEQARTAAPLAGVAKAKGPAVLASTAVAALRRRLGAISGLTQTFRSLYGDAALQATRAASEQLGTVIGGTFASLTRELPADYWSNWTPGWGEAAAQVADGGLRNLLDQAGITIQSVIDSRLDDLGNAIASGIQAGDGVDAIAQTLQGILSDPSRALMIANTETARSMSAQSMSDYRASGVQQIEWLAEDDACPDCQDNEDASPIGIDDTWPGGDLPPHPSCRCSLSPVVDTGDADQGG